MAPSDYAPISDYALIGDCRSAALVSREGSIDWLCWPRFDSPSLFAAILDRDRGGRFSVRPVDPFTSTRRYLGETAILETTFQTRDGLARLTDLMPVASEREKAGALWPDHELLRRVECVEGTVEVEVVFDPRPDYGRIVPRLEHWPNVGLACEHMGRVVALRSDVPLSVDGGPGRRGRLRLSAGETRTLALTFEQGLPVVSPSSDGDVDSRIASTRAWWEAWAADGARFTGPHAEAVQRSAITLKLLSFAPSGAIVAAPTTSLPEDVGGVRNWDYRYCWLRDASLTLRALDDVGHAAEADAFLSWLLHATRLTWPELQVLYDVYGEARIPESVLGHLEGYRRSAPVRVGNAAADQLQLDVYGEVIDAAWRYVRRGGRLDRTMARTLVGFGRTVVRRWREPDEGIWEPRSGRRHHTHSKAMCWLALDRLVDLCARGHVAAEAATFARERDAIRRAIERDGVSERLGCYVSVFGSEGVDASLLLLSVMGYADPRSERMRRTVARVRERLEVNGVVYRYRDDDDGLEGGEAAFGICSFWAVEARALQGDEGAREQFERLLRHANDVGLYAEEIDAASGAAIGNFPQAFTHVGLINAAVALSRSECQATSLRTTASPDGRNTS